MAHIRFQSEGSRRWDLGFCFGGCRAFGSSVGLKGSYIGLSRY